MPSNVFGAPVTDETLKQLDEYEGSDTITREDRARVAMELSNAGGKRTIAREFLENQGDTYKDSIIKGRTYTKCLIYNATGDAVTLTVAADIDGHVGQSPYPFLLGNGQWGAFLHIPDNMSSQGAVLYTGQDAQGNTILWGFGWYKARINHPRAHKVYALIRNNKETPIDAIERISDNLNGSDHESSSFNDDDDDINHQMKFQAEDHSCIASAKIELGVIQPLFVATMTLRTQLGEGQTRALNNGVFGKAISNQTLKKMVKFEKKDDKDITREDRSRVAIEMMYAERGGDQAWAFLEKLRKKNSKWICVMGLIYNATGDTVTLLDHNVSEGIFDQSPSPTIENGQWGVFFHLKKYYNYPSEAKGSIIYTGKNAEGKRVDFLFSWTNLHSHKSNQVYTEINNYVFMKMNKVWNIVATCKPEDDRETYNCCHRGCFITASIGRSLCASFEGIMALDA